MTDTKKYAQKLLDNLIELDHQTTGAYYEMGQILFSIREGKLYDVMGYPSMTALIEEELSYSTGTANRYLQLYADFKRLKYNKVEALKLMRQFGYTHCSHVLPKIKQKVGPRAIRNAIDQWEIHNLNFGLTTEELETARKALLAMGAVKKESRYEHTKDAFMEMVDLVLTQSRKRAA